MDLAKNQQRSLTAERLSRNVTVQALSRQDFKQTSDSLPVRIEGTFDVPKIWEMVQATSEDSVKAFIEFELVKLAERVNVSGNLTDGQIQSIANHIVISFPNETIADFKICFERATNGVYGKIFKLDGIEVGLWIKAYLDEKYDVLEKQWNKERDQYKNETFRTSSEWLQLWKEAIEKTDAEGKVKTTSMNLTALANIRALTPSEIEKEGKEKPAFKPYPYTNPEVYQKELDERTRKGRELWFRDNHPNATEEDILDYLKSFES
jgi:hypothetical protein